MRNLKSSYTSVRKGGSSMSRSVLNSERSLGTVAAVSVSVIPGLSFVAASEVLLTVTPLVLATLRFIVASIVFLPFMAYELRRGLVLKLRDLGELAGLGVMSISIYFWLQYTGVRYAGAGISALLVVGLIPILTGLTSSFLLKERFSASKAFGIALGLIGVGLVTVPNLFLGSIDLMFYVGVISLFANAVLFSFYSTLSKRLMRRINRPLLITACTTIMGTLALIPLSLTSDWGPVRMLQSAQWVSVAYLALVCSCLGYFLWNFALSRLEAMKSSVWLYLEPVVAFIGTAILFGTLPTTVTVLGGFAIILGALLTNLF